MWFVVGLGNPGKRYEETRHNAGFLVVDELSRRWGLPVVRELAGAVVGGGTVAGQEVVLLKPQTFMNRSGQPTRDVVALHVSQNDVGDTELPLDRILVVHDDLDLPYGTVRVKRSGGHGGHNGLRDLHAQLAAPTYPRVRFGIGRPADGIATADHVLGPWPADQRDSLPEYVARAADAVEAVLQSGVTDAMNTFNARTREASEPPKTEPSAETFFPPTLTHAVRGAL